MFLSILAMLLVNNVCAQGFYNKKRKATIAAAATSFRSIQGWKHGFDLNYVGKANWSVGVFTMSNLASSEKGTKRYQGVQFGLPFLKQDRWSLGLNQKIGLYDRHFLGLISTIKADYKLSKALAFSTGIGMSDRYPVFEFKFLIAFKDYL